MYSVGIVKDSLKLDVGHFCPPTFLHSCGGFQTTSFDIHVFRYQYYSEDSKSTRGIYNDWLSISTRLWPKELTDVSSPSMLHSIFSAHIDCPSQTYCRNSLGFPQSETSEQWLLLLSFPPLWHRELIRAHSSPKWLSKVCSEWTESSLFLFVSNHLRMFIHIGVKSCQKETGGL